MPRSSARSVSNLAYSLEGSLLSLVIVLPHAAFKPYDETDTG
ncbi:MULTISPECIES: hypothetical protein [unclassified Rhodococcus (in: high G+C Gram-positive bacteria)]|nr:MULTISPECIES: hypothetical protein [unclassified Rhodococcus (in: high G+C Gram-positive bacteria)]